MLDPCTNSKLAPNIPAEKLYDKQASKAGVLAVYALLPLTASKACITSRRALPVGDKQASCCHTSSLRRWSPLLSIALQDNGLKLSNSWEGYSVLLNPDYRAQVPHRLLGGWAAHGRKHRWIMSTAVQAGDPEPSCSGGWG